ncbi:MAG: MBOAT family protein [Acidobacteria bacterium]|nr:MAG: MBOAT family protein [Acidobacteriota bacterium]
MVFSTHLFIFYFLPLVLLLNYVLPFRYLSLMLTLVSYVFYGWANPKWVLLMLFSSYVDYFCGLVLVKSSGLPLEDGRPALLPKDQPRKRAQKIALAVSMTSNLAILGFFKYFDFFIQNVETVARGLGLGDVAIQSLHVVLPVGVSFYTFQSMSYAIDVYRGNARALRNPIDFQCFVSVFPQLIAGPIIRYQTVAEQIRQRGFSYEKFSRGVAFFSLGLAKKILLANPMGHVADCLFSAGGAHWYDAWYGLLAYAFQIYFDFSGYSDMAVGLGLMLGFVFMKNFDSPYLADSITDFWRRWHISLSTWLRDYLYVPLGGNRRGLSRTYVNLMLVMLLGGLWHGASWNFVIWGGIHGGMLAFERTQGKDSAYRRLPPVLRIAITFLTVCISWVFFRADTLADSWRYCRSLVGLVTVSEGAGAVAASVYTPYHVLVFLTCTVIVWSFPQAWRFTQRLTPLRAGICLALFVASVLMLWTQTVNPFLYYQF